MKDDKTPLADIAAALVDRVKSLGADASDVLAVAGQSDSVEVRNGKLENSERSEGLSIGLRAFVGKSHSVVTASKFDDKDMDDLAERAVAMAKIAPADPYAGIGEAGQFGRFEGDLDIVDDHTPSNADLFQMAKDAEAAGLAVDGVTQAMGAGAGARRREVFYVNSTGFGDGYARTGFSVSAAMVSGEGTNMARDYDYSSSVHFSDLDDPEAIGKSAGVRAVRRANPTRAASQKCPVVFEQRLAGGLVGHLADAIVGGAIARGTSFLKDAMGTQLFPTGFVIADDATLRRGHASKPFDAEGMATRRNVVIEDGVLKTWLMDLRSARQLGLKTTGNASRSTTSAPSASTSNFNMENGDVSFEELIGDIDNGFYVTELIGMGVNPVTGDYSRGASGFWIEKGQLAHPVSELTIAGNLKDMFANMTRANDLHHRGSTNAPTIAIAEMTVAGV